MRFAFILKLNDYAYIQIGHTAIFCEESGMVIIYKCFA